MDEAVDSNAILLPHQWYLDQGFIRAAPLFQSSNTFEMKLTLLSFFLSFCGFVTAQTLSSCAEACVSQAAQQDGCVTFTNITCVCTNAQFQQDARTCLTAECTAADLTELEGLEASLCGASGLSASGTATNTAVFSASGISAGSGTSLSIPATSSGASSGSASGASSSSASGASSGSASSGSATTSAGSTTGPGIVSTSASGSGTATAGGSSSAASATKSSSAQKIEISLGVAFAGLLVGLLG